MSWRNFFKSSHALWLEQQVALERETNRLDRETHALMINALKTSHAEERLRDIQEIQSLRDELARTRLYLTPGIQNISTKPDTSGPPIPENTPTGGAWARVMRREMAAQEEAAKTEKSERERRAAEIAAKESPDGQTVV
jgi:hypothetical protein